MILVNCNSKEYLDEIGYISPTDILDIIPVSYGIEVIKMSDNDINATSLIAALKTSIEEKIKTARVLFTAYVHPYEQLDDMDKTIVFYIPSSESEPSNMKDIVFCIVYSGEYNKKQLLKTMKRYSKLRAFV